MTAGVELPHRAIREQISSAFDLLVQITRLVDGSRRVTHVTEVLRMESDVITLQDLFVARPPDEEQAVNRGSRLLTPLQCTGLKPHFLEKMAASGVILPPNFFKSRRRPALARPSARLVTGAGSEVRVRHPGRARAGRARVRGEPAAPST